MPCKFAWGESSGLLMRICAFLSRKRKRGVVSSVGSIIRSEVGSPDCPFASVETLHHDLNLPKPRLQFPTPYPVPDYDEFLLSSGGGTKVAVDK